MKILHVHIIVICLSISTPLYAGEWDIINVDNEEWVYDKDPTYKVITKSHYTFRNGAKLSTNLMFFKLIKVIKSKDNHSFLFFSGRVCDQCDANTSLYVSSSDIGYFDRDSERHRYPGKLRHYMSGELIEESRVFYGNCVSSSEPVVIWYIKYKDSDGKWRKATVHVELKGKKPIESINSVNFNELSNTLTLVKSGSCAELQGIDGISEP